MVTPGQLSVSHHTSVWPRVSGGLRASKTLGAQNLKNPQLVNSKTPSGTKPFYLLLYIVNFDVALHLFEYIFHEFTYLGYYSDPVSILQPRPLTKICLLYDHYVLVKCYFAL